MAMIASILEVIVLGLYFCGHCLVIYFEMICHYVKTLLCLKLPQHFS